MRKHLFYLPLMLTAALGCSVFERVKEKSGVASDPRRSVAVPQGLNHAAADAQIYADDSVLVRLPNETEVFFGGETAPSTPAQLTDKLARAVGATAADGGKKALYVAAAAENRFGSLADLFRLAEEKGYEKFRLVVRPSAYSPFDHALKIEAPDEWVRKSFPVIADTAGPEAVIPKPNPNTLLVEIDAEARTRLNKEEHSPEKLSALLFEVFRQRELYGIFREGTNEIEKTVFIKAAPSVKYADAVRVVDALAQSGSDKIVLLTGYVVVLPDRVTVHTVTLPEASQSGNSGK